MSIFRKKIALISILCFILYPLFLNSEEQTRSSKRGICFNKLTPEQAQMLSKGVSWCYNWHFTADEFLIKEDSPIEFYPMVWGAHQGQLDGLKEFFEKGFKAKYVLAINEPNLKDQAFITPEMCAKWYINIKDLAEKYGVETIGPHMAIGSSIEASIKAFDPIEKKELTYTYMVPYLNAFYHFIGENQKIRAIAVHSYGNIGELRWVVDELHKKYNKAIWVTEFAWWGAKNEKELLQYMKEAVIFFELSPYVEKYAWFKADFGDNKMSLISKDGKTLTKLGELYIKLPVIKDSP
ncbi:MAG TPA: glycosyl hydrolase [Victivallales bacterium]|nr:glycosyl hydrolase [Victivallales bacterium]HPO90322.1 glycosyl hydrolase [Victivallales bacterium]HRR05881.1 glycosyl hydrolase [Victivallales bacterium]HRR28152.1 glycosyl hydrolase [Victivallales bacterium]HRU00750.1 glycosyl hydrolase [Victivallales bacterium]